MQPAEYDYMFQVEDTLWWYVGMRRICAALLRRFLPSPIAPLRILDAGCGSGGSLRLLERFGSVTGLDISEQAVRFYLRRQRGRVCLASTDAVPFADASFDLVTSFDVLYQFESATTDAALSELARVLRSGGTLLVRVPAFQALYGPHDVKVNGKHRFSAPELRARIEKAGLRVVHTTYANTLLFPIAAGRRLWAKLNGDQEGSDVRPMPDPLNRLFRAVLCLESPLLAHASLPYGLSVIAIARKP